MTISKTIVFSFFSGVLGAVVILAGHFYATQAPPQIGVVNIQDILERHIKDYAARQLTKEEQQQAAADFSRALEAEINELAQDNNIHLLVSPAVLSRVPDYTGVIEQQLKVHNAF